MSLATKPKCRCLEHVRTSEVMFSKIEPPTVAVCSVKMLELIWGLFGALQTVNAITSE